MPITLWKDRSRNTLRPCVVRNLQSACSEGVRNGRFANRAERSDMPKLGDGAKTAKGMAPERARAQSPIPRRPKPPHAVDNVVGAIGPKIRELRAQRGLSLQQLADRAEVSPAAIHKIEHNGMVPTIATLMKLAVALNRPVSFLIDEATPDGPVAFTPTATGRPVFTSKSGLTLTSITGPYGRFYLAGAAATFEPHASSGEAAMEHPGEELIYLLEGALEVEVAGETFRLRSGDAIHFRTDRPHRWRNPGARRARAVWMTQRPT
jgi:quercetin dioxygenase-like cupin family protein/ribosome-binding protein aMBF1 (putative translation factor)